MIIFCSLADQLKRSGGCFCFASTFFMAIKHIHGIIFWDFVLFHVPTVDFSDFQDGYNYHLHGSRTL